MGIRRGAPPLTGIEATWYRSVIPVSTSGVGEDNLHVAPTMQANKLRTTSRIVIEARGTITGVAGTHTVKFYLGTHTYTIRSATATAGSWWFKGEIQITGAATQLMVGEWWDADGSTFVEDNTGIQAISGALAAYFTGECSNAGDTITQTVSRIGIE